jgi:hypothetical protein
MISVSDRQLRVVAAAADLLPVEVRGTFLRRVVVELRGRRDFSDCDIKVCPEQAIDISVIAVTFRGAAPGVVTNGGWTFGSPVLRRDRKLAAAG